MKLSEYIGNGVGKIMLLNLLGGSTLQLGVGRDLLFLVQLVLFAGGQ